MALALEKLPLLPYPQGISTISPTTLLHVMDQATQYAGNTMLLKTCGQISPNQASPTSIKLLRSSMTNFTLWMTLILKYLTQLQTPGHFGLLLLLSQVMDHVWSPTRTLSLCLEGQQTAGELNSTIIQQMNGLT